MTAPARSPSTAVVTIEPPGPTMVERAKTKELAPFVTMQARALIEPLLRHRGATFDQVLSEIYLAIKQNPELEECTGHSLLLASARILSWGLVIGEGAFLVSFNVKVKDKSAPGGERWEARAKEICGYQGAAQRVVNAGGARSIIAKCVYQNELDQGRFDYHEGSVPRVDHRPILIKSQRGALVGAYARAIIDRTSPPLIHWMDLEEIDEIRQKHSKSWKDKWIDEPTRDGGTRRKKVPLPLDEIEWYVKKTPILQLCKMLPKTEKSAAVLADLEREEREEFEDVAIDVEAEDADAVAGQRTTAAPAPAAAAPAAAAPAPAAAAPAPAAAPAGSPTDGHSLEWAKAFPFPLKKGTVTYGKPIGEFSTDHLVSIAEWVDAKQQVNGLEFHADLRRAVTVILKDRDAKASAAAGATADAKAAATLADDEDDLPF